jgi:Cof subfamily protein (haloacid dehalogenase superfamily)
MDAGVYFAFCSGRSHMSLKHFEEELGVVKAGNYGISYNGSIVYETDTHKILLERPLKKAAALELLGLLRRFDVDMVVYTRDALYAEAHSANVDEYQRRSGISMAICGDFREIKDDFAKILLIGDYGKRDKSVDTKLTQAYDGMTGKTDGLCNMFYSAGNLLEFTDPSAHKGSGLEFLAEYLGVKREETIAMGDNYNDITMLEWAGLGVAVRNAKPEVQAAADYVTRGTNDENAVKEIIDTFIFKNGA